MNFTKSSALDIKIEKSDFVAAAKSAGSRARHSGWLEKRGQKGGATKRRWFVLDQNCLFYYASQDLATVVGMIWVEDCTCEVAADARGSGSSRLTQSSNESEGTFRINTVGSRQYVLSAADEAERDAWMETLRGSQFAVVHNEARRRAASAAQHLQRYESSSVQLTQSRDDALLQFEEAQAAVAAADERAAAAEAALEAERAAAADVASSAAEALELLEAEKALLAAKVARTQGERDLLRRVRGLRALPPAATTAATDPGLQGSVDQGFAPPAPLRLWVGSWNLGAAEPFEPGSGAGPRLLRNSFVLGDPCDLYFLGLQEGVSESVFHATEALCAILAACDRLPLDDASADRDAGGAASGSASAAPVHGAPSASSSSSSSSGGGGSSCGEKHLTARDKIHGRGDGSLVSTKFTGLAVFVNKAHRRNVRVLGCVAHPLEKLGSKGGVAVALDVAGETLVFVTSHLEAMKRDTRRLQYKELIGALGEKLGEAGFGFTSQFHHVVWAGDLNYRCVELGGEPMPADKAIALLSAGSNGALFEDHDQLNQERRAGEVFAGFCEPAPDPHFFPTYKKVEGRDRFEAPVDYGLPDWPNRVYRTKYKEPIYKGGNVKERCPGYTDRILFHSLPDAAPRLVPERRPLVLTDAAPTAPSRRPSALEAGTAASEEGGGETSTIALECDNYRSVNEGPGMSVSDHSPVFATFLLHPANHAGRTAASLNHRAQLAGDALTMPSPPSPLSESATTLMASSAPASTVELPAEPPPPVPPFEPLLLCPTVWVEVSDVVLSGGKPRPEALTSVKVLFPAPFECSGAFAHCKGMPVNGWREEPTKGAKTDCRLMCLDGGPGFLGASGDVPKLRFLFDTRRRLSGPVGVGGLHLLLRVGGGSFVTVGHHSGDAADTPMKDRVAGECTVSLSSLWPGDGGGDGGGSGGGGGPAAAGAAYTLDGAGGEKKAVLRLKGLPLSLDGRPACVAPADAQSPLANPDYRLRIDLTVCVSRIE